MSISLSYNIYQYTVITHFRIYTLIRISDTAAFTVVPALLDCGDVMTWFYDATTAPCVSRRWPSTHLPIKQVPPFTIYRTSDIPYNLATIRLNDLCIIDTLGVGGFGRVELVCFTYRYSLPYQPCARPRMHLYPFILFICLFICQGHVWIAV